MANLDGPYQDIERGHENAPRKTPLLGQVLASPRHETAPRPRHETAPNFQNLMALWLHHKAECRPIGQILIEARSGKLPGVAAGILPDQFEIINESAALVAMSKKESS